MNNLSTDKNYSPEQALQTLKEGNQRFTNGTRAVESMLSHLKMADLADRGQKPFAIVLTCSDSRSPVEMIFDQGLGDVFVVRVAGNVIAPSLLASIEFAAANFGSPLILVMGHTQCGAVNGTYKHVKNPGDALPSIHLEELISRIRPAVERTMAISKETNESNLVELCSIENVKRSMAIITEQSAIVRNLLDQKKVMLVGSVLNIKSGKVDFL